jgi:hypothetical protein
LQPRETVGEVAAILREQVGRELVHRDGDDQPGRHLGRGRLDRGGAGAFRRRRPASGKGNGKSKRGTNSEAAHQGSLKSCGIDGKALMAGVEAPRKGVCPKCSAIYVSLQVCCRPPCCCARRLCWRPPANISAQLLVEGPAAPGEQSRWPCG